MTDQHHSESDASVEWPERWSTDPTSPSELPEALRTLQVGPSPAAQARVWRAIHHTPKEVQNWFGYFTPASNAQKRVWPIFLGSTTAVAITAFMAFFMTQTQQTPFEDIAFRAVVAEVEGSVSLRSDTGPSYRAAPGQPMKVGTRIFSGPKSTATIRHASGQWTLVSKGVAILETPRSLRLTRGEIAANIQVKSITPNHAQSVLPSVLKAGVFAFTAASARFRVSQGSSGTMLLVLEGEVEVEGPSGHTTMTKSEQPQKLSDSAEIGNGSLTQAAGSESPASPARINQQQTNQAKRTRAIKERAFPPQSAFEKHPQTETPPSKEQQPEVNTEEQYSNAMSEKNTHKAVRLLDAIARTGGPHSEIATYEAARRSRLLDRRDAQQRFAHYLNSYPNGIFRLEAHFDLTEGALYLKDWKRAIAHADKFLRAFPKNAKAVDVYFMRAEAKRQGQADYLSAIADYRKVTTGQRTANALYFKAWCLMKLEHRSAAMAVLKSYLARYPNGNHALEVRARLTEMSR